MKSLLKIYGRYIGSTWVILAILCMVNFSVLAWITLDRVIHYEHEFPKDFRKMAELLVERDSENELFLTQQGKDFLEEKGYAFLMLLNDAGDVIFAWNLPKDLKDHYTAGEISAFSRWYLSDYPVKVWKTREGLLVAGGQKNSLWKFTLELPMGFMEHIGQYLYIIAGANLMIILSVIGFLGYRYYKSLFPLSEGIEALSRNQRIHLAEKGAAGELAGRINRTSDILERQRQMIQKRDMARTEWIAGISHDIRIPLSVIMGYADELMENENLEESDRIRAGVIRNQSIKIRQLIEDLNLTSKLEYNMQPLRVTSFYPAALLRTLAAEFINEGLDGQWEVSLAIEPELEGTILKGDEELIKRAVRNLLSNSTRHNADGCSIWLRGEIRENSCVIKVSDDGIGIPDKVVRCLLEEDGDTLDEKKPHIMGLRIVKQIAKAHKGDFQISEKGHCVNISFPIT